ncbi:DUF397 domain-containing protein [Allostreptomyces psammosilenae]|uniref:DUF397 domain-containing protein n=1 Tax=Allostreptomyces psammosilenae TaxID=1892865 RepID=A0A852ZUV0_9ACTN|nr:DUF397 domain-containing protein [Allostreptomyces psammosilenae]NYI05695.1 hypothetical protein [Allostreptomyces psammosilenae]
MLQIRWRKSSFSSSEDNCIEVAVSQDGMIAIRESDDPSTIITTTPAKLAAFIQGVKAGEFDDFAF